MNDEWIYLFLNIFDGWHGISLFKDVFNQRFNSKTSFGFEGANQKREQHVNKIRVA